MKRKFYQYLIVSGFILTITTKAFAQETQDKFLYKKQSSNSVVSYSLTGPYTVEIPKPKLTQPRTYERSITTTNGNYNFVLNKKEKKCALFSADGQSLGTFPLKGKRKLDITMTDGTVYTWQKGKSSRQWKYLMNAKEVFTCSFIKEDGKKYLQYEIKDADAANLSTAIVISHIYGVDLIQLKARQPIYYGLAVGLGVLSAVTSSSSPGPDID